MPTPHVYLGLPSYGSVHPTQPKTVEQAARTLKVTVKAVTFSLLDLNFTALWALALNARKTDGVTHFGMLHADIQAETGWLDTLFWELVTHDADVLSVVVPIKDSRGLTSTAIPQSPDNPWKIERRITMRELADLPETFSAADYGYPGRHLLLNTGCWVARLDRPWCETVAFNTNVRLSRRENGDFAPEVESEDWNFSRHVAAAGGKLMATKKVKVTHFGEYGFVNHGEPWGAWEHDREAAV